MTRGFATIATGPQNFYRMARNLVRSYRLHTVAPMPFAIICDREDEQTACFDQVVLVDDPKRSYVDKLELPRTIPFDETIFIDADSLAYADLNDFWEAFQGAGDFCAFGMDYPPSYPYAWFTLEGAGRYRSAVRFIPDFIGGVYYLRKSVGLEAFCETCHDILDCYQDFSFRQFAEPADEPVYALAMAVHGFHTTGARSLPVCFYPHATRFRADIAAGTVSYDDIYRRENGLMQGAYLVHWGSGNAGRPPYLYQERLLDAALAGRSLCAAERGLAAAGVNARWAASKVGGRIGARMRGER